MTGYMPYQAVRGHHCQFIDDRLGYYDPVEGVPMKTRQFARLQGHFFRNR